MHLGKDCVTKCVRNPLESIDTVGPRECSEADEVMMYATMTRKSREWPSTLDVRRPFLAEEAADSDPRGRSEKRSVD